MNSLKVVALAISLAFPVTAFAAHPLTTEDTGVQGTGNWQFELNTDRSVERYTRNASLTANATLTRGLSDTVDLAVNVPWQRNQVGEDPMETQRGWGDISVFMKWRIYEQDKLSFALKPLLMLPTGNSDKGLGSDRLQPGVTGIASWGDEKFTVLGNVGYLRADNKVGENKDIWSASVATLVSVADQFRLVAELGSYRNCDPETSKNPIFGNVGLVFSPNDKLDLDIGYRKGLNKAEVKYSVGAGVTVRW